MTFEVHQYENPWTSILRVRLFDRLVTVRTVALPHDAAR